MNIKWGPYKEYKTLNKQVHRYRYGLKRPSLPRAKLLEKITGIPVIAWLNPQEVFNPECAWMYESKWPPSLEHLEEGTWGHFQAQKLLEYYPRRKPTKEEFKRWMTTYYKWEVYYKELEDKYGKENQE